MRKHLTEKNLNNFTSNIKYSYFENGKDNCGDIDFHSEIYSDLILYPNLIRISEKFAKALCFIYDNKMNHPHDFDKDLCSYLYYWIGDKIYSNSSNKGVFTKLITMFFDVLNSTHLSYICGTLKTGIDKDTFKNNKLLFDYSKNHENIKLDTVYGDATCDKKYKDSLQNYIKIYKDAYSNCTGNSEKKYECDKYSEIWDEELYQKLSTFSCIHSENGRAVLELQEAYEQQQPAQVQNYIQDSATLPSPHRIPARDEDLVKNQHTRGQTFPRAYEPIQLDDTSGNSSSKTIAGSVAPVLGVSSISLLLYKVTPLGGFIRNFLGRNRNMYNPVEYMDSFNPYNDGMDPGGRTMNISYHRL